MANDECKQQTPANIQSWEMNGLGKVMSGEVVQQSSSTAGRIENVPITTSEFAKGIDWADEVSVDYADGYVCSNVAGVDGSSKPFFVQSGSVVSTGVGGGVSGVEGSCYDNNFKPSSVPKMTSMQTPANIQSWEMNGLGKVMSGEVVQQSSSTAGRIENDPITTSEFAKGIDWADGVSVDYADGYVCLNVAGVDGSSKPFFVQSGSVVSTSVGGGVSGVEGSCHENNFKPSSVPKMTSMVRRVKNKPRSEYRLCDYERSGLKNWSRLEMVRSVKSHHKFDDLTLKLDGKSTDQKTNAVRSKHSETEQRRRSKINER
ncbi:hypothetical protein TEA_017430 [Camellia sinensis var. sinensis]|uniref:BHLH domain-containing protein n=1 Tax=Camellia sinensis var. sinensis TaxID=542762 RepID=A0A4V3WND6_CAMSN|nr:hypothetical protein TEA_017430 [Camellia sinensis var. sinensis]